MYLAIFVLLMVAGSWTAWRRNPMYSTRSTMRGIIAYLLMVGALIGAMMGVIHLTSNRSPAVAMTSLFSFIAVGSIAMIWGIMKLSAPKVAAVPSSVETVHFYRRKIRVWVKRLGWSLLVLGVLAVAIPGEAKYAVAAVAGMLVFLALVLLFAGYFAALNQDRALTALKYKSWVHWTYSPEQWDAWTDTQVTRVQAVPSTFVLRKAWLGLLVVYIAVGTGTFLFCQGSVLFKALYTLVIWGVLSGMIVLGKKGEAGAAGRLRTAMKLAGSEVFFGDEGVFCDGVLMPWISTADWLLEAVVDESAPRNLLLRFEKIEPGNAGAPQASVVVQRVLLPEDSTADLATLQRELTAKCTKARVAIC
jgi:hypothetical protein